jgi:DNA-binding PadR family transcriptional regulator
MPVCCLSLVLLFRLDMTNVMSTLYTLTMNTIGQFEQAVLVAILRLGEDAYGRAILNEVQNRLDREVSAGAVYATLERLEAKGLASSRLAPGTAIRGGRARRYFAPTAAGVRALNDAKRASDFLWRGLAWPQKVRT